MYLRAGVISLTLLLASRVLGLLRESVQAATFGTTALGDLVVAMLTLPDLASAILASGALSYALLPLWARQPHAVMLRSQRRVAGSLWVLGVAIAGLIWVMPATFGRWLVPGAQDLASLVEALRWAAIAIPFALLGSLWYTRLQHERDVVGMYGMNVVHTGVVVLAILWLQQYAANDAAIEYMGLGLLLALGLRLLFLMWRLGRLQTPAMGSGQLPAGTVEAALLPSWKVWAWALAATGAPVLLVLLARSLVSSGGEGALATFNYAWKLVELPNLLAIQLVTTLAYPALTRARAEGRDFSVQLAATFMLSWTLACAGALGLWLGSVPVSQVLFGWGRMEPGHVAQVAQWAAWGGWTLLPQALIAVTVLVLATVGRLYAVAIVYALALVVLAGLGFSGLHEGRAVMMVLVAVMAAQALLLLRWLGASALRALPWRQMAVPAALCAALSVAGRLLPVTQPMLVLLVAVLFAGLLLVASYAASPVLRVSLKR